MKTLKKLMEIKETEITDITTTNIEKIIINTVNQSSFIVSASNNISYDNVKFVNVKGTIEITQNNNACVIMDQQFNDDLTQNITTTTVSNFYNEIINNLTDESLEYIELNIKNNYPNVYVNFEDYVEIENKTYTNILNRIKTVLENSNIAEIINKQVVDSQQFNILNIEDSQFGFESSETMTEEEYNERKIGLKVVNKQTNTTKLLIKNIVKNLQVSSLLNNVVEDLQNYEDVNITEETEETEKPEEKQQEQQSEGQKQQEDQKDNDKQKDNNKQEKQSKTKKIIFYSLLSFIILIILIFIILLIKKLKK